MTCSENDRIRNSTRALACGALLTGLLLSSSASAVDSYEPNNTWANATDLHALRGNPTAACLSRSANYWATPVDLDAADEDWFIFKLRAEASVDTYLHLRTDATVTVELYDNIGFSGFPSPAATAVLNRTVLQTLSEPFGYVHIPLPVEDGSRRGIWFLRIVPVAGAPGEKEGEKGSEHGKGKEMPMVQYDFSVTAENRYFHEATMESGLVIPYYSNENQLLEHKAEGEQVLRTVLVQHGNSRNAWDYFEYVYQAAETDGIEDRVLIIAPSFLIEDDCDRADEPRWSSRGWKFGEESVLPVGGPTVSSYTVLDWLVEMGTDARWPSVEKVVFAGHSAGGQLAHRYASATAAPEAIAPIPMSFLPANAGSYMWPDSDRPIPWSYYSQVPTSGNLLDFYRAYDSSGNELLMNADCNGDGVISSGEVSGCLASTVSATDVDFTGDQVIDTDDALERIDCVDHYDDYPYGIVDRHLVPYLSGDGDLTDTANFVPWIDRYTSRDMTVLLGTLDVQTYGDNNQWCQQRVQGAHRVARGINYSMHFDAFHPGHSFGIDVVPGMGHSGRGMFQSRKGKHYLFYDGGSFVEPPFCGLGFESALILPLWVWLRRRRARA